MPLSDTVIRNAKGKDAPFKLFDDGGLFMIVSPAGGKLWRLKYRFAGKEQQLTIGKYPAVGLKDARGKREEAKDLLAKGVEALNVYFDVLFLRFESGEATTQQTVAALIGLVDSTKARDC